jgi:IgA Peptidase M64/Peptidase M64 N-terminus
MKKVLVFVLLLTAQLAAAAPRTLRVDYYHTGNATQERFSLDRVVVEPLDWPGNPARPIDRTNLGQYFFEVVDSASGRVLYSRGFSSIYGEWETTAEARSMNRTFSESLRFPMPAAPVDIHLQERDRGNAFREVWRVHVDPADQNVDRAASSDRAGPLITFQRSGDPARKLDLLLIGDGYTAAERGKFTRDARRLLDTFFSTSPFKERRAEVNVWGLVPAAEASGISHPSAHLYRHSPLGASYDAFGTDRYILTFDNRAFRDIAAHAPYDVVEIVANSAAYGGGGIFNLYSTVAADSAWAPYIFMHEFGHHLAGLADEYYTSEVAYLPPATLVEPWEPNVTADPAHAKWKDLVTPGVPLPTPWPKEAFDRHTEAVERQRARPAAGQTPAEAGALARQAQERTAAILASGPYGAAVGAFEGANYLEHGYYRPQQDCIMFSRDHVPFCAVCRRAIDVALDLYTSP